MLKLHKATLVILAEAHNPTIVSPAWLQNALSVKDPPSHFVHTPPFSLFDSTSFILTVDTGRLELVCKLLDEEHISACAEIAGNYFRTLPHIPYRSLGLNYIWQYSVEPGGKPLPQVRLAIGDLNLAQVFGTESIQYGGTVKVALKPYLLTLKIDHETDRTVVLNYNFNYVIENAHKAADMTKSFLPLKSRSYELTQSILIGEGPGNG